MTRPRGGSLAAPAPIVIARRAALLPVAWGAAEMQKRFYEVVPYIPPAQFLAPTAYRKNLKGVLDTARLVLWNIEKD